MKRIITTIIVPCIAILLAGCSNTLDDSFNGDFEDVFRKEYTNVFDPIDPFAGYDAEIPSLRHIDSRFIDYVNSRVSSVLNESGGIMPGDLATQYKEVYATIINDNRFLQSSSWPDIDFNRYTLIIGWFVAPGSGYYINRQRLQIKKDESILYLQINEDHTPGYDSHTCALTAFCFAALYPKFEGHIKVVSRWD